MIRLIRLVRIASLFALGVCLVTAGCSPETTETESAVAPTVQLIRVRLLQDVQSAGISASANPTMSVQSMRRELIFPPHGSIAVSRVPGGWRIGSFTVGGSVLALFPGSGGTLSVNDSPYRGSLRFVPLDDGGFDVVNDVEIDDYLKGVLAVEMYRDWQLEAYKAQAVVARTYALYHSHTEGLNRYWDVYPDTRSQVYGGISAETDKSRVAAADTAGLVLVYGPGEGHIFEAFFSSDCGGVTQSAADAFGLSGTIPPLESHPDGDCGKASPYHNWGPITLDKAELTRRMVLWASHRTPPRPEVAMTGIEQVDLGEVNPYGRPKSFRVTDANGSIYTMAAEEMRAAFDTDAPPGTQNSLPSSFCKVRTDSTAVVFYDGHGLGHGVGMCQWCAEEQASEGHSFDQIVLAAYPQAKLARAY
jgi:stage II sporulation protein D